MPKRKFIDVYDAFTFLQEHPMVYYDKLNHFHKCLNIEIVKINPETGMVDDEIKNNTKTEVWLEFGKYDLFEISDSKSILAAQHDIDLDCGAPTFEEAIIELANLVYKKYGKKRECE